MIGRRAVLWGGIAAGILGGVGILGVRMLTNGARRAAAASADYLGGRVVVVAGWIMSETEAADVPLATTPPEPTSAATSEPPGGE